MAKLKACIETKEADTQSLNQVVQTLRSEIKTNEKSVRDLQQYLDNYKRLNEGENARYQELKSENDDLGKKLNLLGKENRRYVLQMEQNQARLDDLEQKLAKSQEKRDALERKLKLVEEAKSEIESKKITCQLQFEAATKILKNCELEKDTDKKQIEILVHDKEKVFMELKKTSLNKEKTRRHENALRMQIKRLDIEKNDSLKQIDSLKKVISDFDKERNEFVSNFNEIMLKTNHLTQEVKIKDGHLEISAKKLKSYVIKLDMLQEALDAARKDSNLYSRSVCALKEELRLARKNTENCGSLELSFKKVLNQKEASNSKLTSENLKLEKLLAQLRKSLSEKDLVINECKCRLNSFEVSEKSLLKITLDLEKKLKLLQETCSKYKVERSMLGDQLMGRNHQISILFEKISYLANTLKEGELCFEKKVAAFDKLKLEYEKILKENQLLKSEKVAVKSLKSELDSKQQELVMEKAKTYASEKFHKSFNIHRWRKLKGCDPTSYWLILKINMLQKRLIFKAEQVANLQMKFVEKDKLFLELKQSLSRRILTDETSAVFEKNQQMIDKLSRQLKVIFFYLSCITVIQDYLKK